MGMIRRKWLCSDQPVNVMLKVAIIYSEIMNKLVCFIINYQLFLKRTILLIKHSVLRRLTYNVKIIDPHIKQPSEKKEKNCIDAHFDRDHCCLNMYQHVSVLHKIHFPSQL